MGIFQSKLNGFEFLFPQLPWALNLQIVDFGRIEGLIVG
jgi:hypothetical protein